MSTTYGTQSSITIPSDGDTIDAADVNVPLAASWDQHDFLDTLVALKAILVPTHGLIRYVRGYGHYVFVTSGTYSASTAASPWILAATDGTAGRWVMDLTAEANKTAYKSFGCADILARGSDAIAKTHDPSAAATQWSAIDDDGNASSAVARTRFYFDRHGIRFYNTESASAIGRHVLFPLNGHVINGATITSALLILNGAAGHGGLPAMMPALGLVRHDHVADTWASLKSGTAMVDDTSASVAAYEAIHGITCNADQNNVVDVTTYSYYAIVCNEGDVNATASLRLRQIVLTQSTKGYM